MPDDDKANEVHDPAEEKKAEAPPKETESTANAETHPDDAAEEVQPTDFNTVPPETTPDAVEAQPASQPPPPQNVVNIGS